MPPHPEEQLQTRPSEAAPRASLIGWLLVAAQLCLVAVLIADLRHIRRAASLRRATGGTIAILGVATMVASAAQLGRGLHPHPAPTASAVLRTGGLYRHVRHPLYSGLLLWAAGAALIGGTARGYAALAGLTAVLALKAPYEERQLAKRFPAYPEYARHTPRFLPRLRPPRGAHTPRPDPPLT